MTDSSHRPNFISQITAGKVRRCLQGDGSIRWTFGHLTRCDRGSALSAPPMLLGISVVLALVFGPTHPGTLFWGAISIALSVLVIPWAVGGDMVSVIELPSRLYWFEFRIFGLLTLRSRRSTFDETTLVIDWQTVNNRSKRLLKVLVGRRHRFLFSVFPEEDSIVRYVERRLKRDFTVPPQE